MTMVYANHKAKTLPYILIKQGWESVAIHHKLCQGSSGIMWNATPSVSMSLSQAPSGT